MFGGVPLIHLGLLLQVRKSFGRMKLDPVLEGSTDERMDGCLPLCETLMVHLAQQETISRY